MADPTTLPGWRWLPGMQPKVDGDRIHWHEADTTDPMYPHYLHRMARLHSGCETLGVKHCADHGVAFDTLLGDDDPFFEFMGVWQNHYPTEADAYLAVLAIPKEPT